MSTNRIGLAGFSFAAIKLFIRAAIMLSLPLCLCFVKAKIHFRSNSNWLTGHSPSYTHFFNSCPICTRFLACNAKALSRTVIPSEMSASEVVPINSAINF